MNSKRVKRGGLGLVGTLTQILIVLKAFELIHLSWFWVLSPVWIPILIAAILFSAVLVIDVIKKGK